MGLREEAEMREGRWGGLWVGGRMEGRGEVARVVVRWSAKIGLEDGLA